MTRPTLVRWLARAHVDLGVRRLGHNGPMARWMVRTAMVLVAAAAVLAWLAVGALAETETDRDSQSKDVAAVATASAALADQLQATLDGLAIGTNSAAEAVVHMETISVNVRAILAQLDGVDGAEAITSDLANAEAALLEAEGGLRESVDAVAAAQPAIAAAADELETAAQRLGETAATGDGTHTALARGAVVLGALALMMVLGALDRRPRRGGQP